MRFNKKGSDRPGKSGKLRELANTESAKSRGLRGNAGYVGAWICGLRRLGGPKYFLHGSTFYVGNNFYLGYVGQIYFFVGQFFWVDLCVGQHFLRGSKIFERVYFYFFFALVNFYLLDKIILLYYN